MPRHRLIHVPELRRDAGLADSYTIVQIRRFTRAILHGDGEHRQWLMDAAEAFIRNKPMPVPRQGPPNA